MNLIRGPSDLAFAHGPFATVHAKWICSMEAQTLIPNNVSTKRTSMHFTEKKRHLCNLQLRYSKYQHQEIHSSSEPKFTQTSSTSKPTGTQTKPSAASPSTEKADSPSLSTKQKTSCGHNYADNGRYEHSEKLSIGQAIPETKLNKPN
ncbi:hypothetical protein S245_031215 [Arachis hypogaea]